MDSKLTESVVRLVEDGCDVEDTFRGGQSAVRFDVACHPVDDVRH